MCMESDDCDGVGRREYILFRSMFHALITKFDSHRANELLVDITCDARKDEIRRFI